jgi:phosphoribosylglycinamide formyltransferase-1
MTNLAFFASYNGSSAQVITDACFHGDLIASPILLITNNPNAKALEWAKEKGLKTVLLNNQDAMKLDQQIAQKLQQHKIDMVCCSGYMKLIGGQTIAAVHGRILNIHPALLPKYGGKGMYGSYVHQAVKESGDTKTGCTIHLVSDEYDKGKVLAQKTISIIPQDTVLDIEEKIKAIEPKFYIETLNKILKNKISLH